MESFPELTDVVQVIPDAPQLTFEAVDEILDGVRPFLSVAGGSVQCDKLSDVGGLQPQVHLKMTGAASSVKSVRSEIAQRIGRTFMMPNLRVVWSEEN